MQSQLKILFVDDHVGLRDGMKEMLKSKNPDFILSVQGITKLPLKP